MTTDDLASALRDIAEETWQASRKPMLLSGLPSELGKRLPEDYKLVLGDETLKSYIKASGSNNGYRLVEHPTQKAKLGIVPAGASFEFFTESTIPVASEDLSRQDIEGFVRVLRSLPTDELRGLSLPAGLVVRLLGTK